MGIAEDWKASTYTGALVQSDFVQTPGPRHSLSLDPDAMERSIWIASGASFQQTLGDFWFIQGKLTFTLGSSPAGYMIFGDASQALLAIDRLNAQRTIFQIKPDGSAQPTLRYSEYLGGIPVTFLDIPCFRIRLRADRVVYEIEKSWCNLGAGNQLNILTGLRVVSSSTP